MVDAFLDRDGGGLLSSIAHLGGGGIDPLGILSTLRSRLALVQLLSLADLKEVLVVCDCRHVVVGPKSTDEAAAQIINSLYLPSWDTWLRGLSMGKCRQ